MEGLASFQKPVSRRAFIGAGGVLFLLKCVLDAYASNAFGEEWSPLMYFTPRVSPLFHPAENPGYWVTLLAIALPFMVAGVRLCAGRLADMGVRPLWSGLFFFPFVHWAFFVVIALAPKKSDAPAPKVEDLPAGDVPEGTVPHVELLDEPPLLPGLAGLIPEGTPGRFVLAVVGSALACAFGLAVLAVAPSQHDAPFFAQKEVLGTGLFFGLPFGLGFWSAFVMSYRRGRETFVTAFAAAMTSLLVGLLLLIAVAYEGAACIVMASPILAGSALVGAIVGHLAAKLPSPARSGIVAAAFVLFLLGRDVVRPPEPVELVETTEIQVAAAPEVVWRHVTSITPIDEAPDAIFAICAMPLESRIVGQGVGAARTCRLTVGDLDETVEVWDEARELTFRVDRAPARFARYGAVHRGQFLLLRNADGSTTLRGTTWYSMKAAPAAYWSLWTQAFVEAVHRRVMNHVKRLAENPGAAATSQPSEQPAWMSAVNATCNCTRHAPER